MSLISSFTFSIVVVRNSLVTIVLDFVVRAVKSITTDKEDKDIEAKENKIVKIIETDKSENKQVKAGQKTMDNFMKTSNRPSAIQKTPPTPTEKLHDQQGSSKGRKKLKPSNRKT